MNKWVNGWEDLFPGSWSVSLLHAQAHGSHIQPLCDQPCLHYISISHYLAASTLCSILCHRPRAPVGLAFWMKWLKSCGFVSRMSTPDPPFSLPLMYALFFHVDNSLSLSHILDGSLSLSCGAYSVVSVVSLHKWVCFWLLYSISLVCSLLLNQSQPLFIAIAL